MIHCISILISTRWWDVYAYTCVCVCALANCVQTQQVGNTLRGHVYVSASILGQRCTQTHVISGPTVGVHVRNCRYVFCALEGAYMQLL